MKTPLAPIRWFPRLSAGIAYPAADHARMLTTLAWLLMTEAFAYAEDIEGADEAPDLLEIARIRLAELLFDLDCRMAGAVAPNELHHLPMLLETGFSELAYLNGAEIVEHFGLAAEVDPVVDIARVVEGFQDLLTAFPGDLVNALLPENQGQVIKALRQWNAVCGAAGTDPAFLVPLIQAL